MIVNAVEQTITNLNNAKEADLNVLHFFVLAFLNEIVSLSVLDFTLKPFLS